MLSSVWSVTRIEVHRRLRRAARESEVTNDDHIPARIRGDAMRRDDHIRAPTRRRPADVPRPCDRAIRVVFHHRAINPRRRAECRRPSAGVEVYRVLKQHPDEDAAIRRACRALAIFLACGTELKRKGILRGGTGGEDEQRCKEEAVHDEPNTRGAKT